MAYNPLSGLKPTGKAPKNVPAPPPSGGSGGSPPVHKSGTGGESKAREAAAARAKAAAKKAAEEAEAAKRRAEEAAKKREEAVKAQIAHDEQQRQRIADVNAKNVAASEASQRAQQKAGESADILAAAAQKQQADENQKRRLQLSAKLDQLKGAKAPEDETIEEKQRREDALRQAGLLPQTVAAPGAMRGPATNYPAYTGLPTPGMTEQASMYNLARQGVDWMRNAFAPTGQPVTSSMGPEVGLGMSAQFPNVQAMQGQGQLPNVSVGMPPAPVPNVPQGLPWQNTPEPYSSSSVGGPRVDMPGVDSAFFKSGALPGPQSLAPETGLPNLPVFFKDKGNYSRVDMTAPGQQPMLPLPQSMDERLYNLANRMGPFPPLKTTGPQGPPPSALPNGLPVMARPEKAMGAGLPNQFADVNMASPEHFENLAQGIPWDMAGMSMEQGRNFLQQHLAEVVNGPGSLEQNLADALATYGAGGEPAAVAPPTFNPLSGLGQSSRGSSMPMAPTLPAEYSNYAPYGGGFFPFMMFGGGGGGYDPAWAARLNNAYTTYMGRGI